MAAIEMRAKGSACINLDSTALLSCQPPQGTAAAKLGTSFVASAVEPFGKSDGVASFVAGMACPTVVSLSHEATFQAKVDTLATSNIFAPVPGMALPASMSVFGNSSGVSGAKPPTAGPAASDPYVLEYCRVLHATKRYFSEWLQAPNTVGRSFKERAFNGGKVKLER